MSRRPLTLLLVLLLALAAGTAGPGCASGRRSREASQAVTAYFAGDLRRSIELLEPLAHVPDGNYVLNNLRLGQAALAAGDLRTAEAAYYRAYETLNAAGVNNGARTAATVLFNERVRIWLGEPYERAIANYQLGVVYYLQGDYGNARGAFENALFRLRRYADEEDADKGYTEQESTFAVAYVLLGRCWQRLGREDLAEQNFAKARDLDPSLGPLADPALHARTNVLLIVEWGTAPEKVAEGSALHFATAPTTLLPQPRVSVDGRLAAAASDAAVPTTDTHVMALQRRWQTVDTFRAVREVVGAGSMIGGVIVLDQGLRRDNEEAALAGIGLIALGALLNASSAPDTRQWEMAPRTIYLIPLELPPGTHEIEVALPDPRGWGDMVQRFRNVPVAPDGRETALYARMLPGIVGDVDFAAPPTGPAPEPELNTDSHR